MTSDSKLDAPDRIRVDANIKYTVSAYLDSCPEVALESRLWQTSNVRFKLRISQNKKRTAKSSAKQLW